MPEISRFYGIAIRIFYSDHFPPHFHAEYGEYETLVDINTLAVIAGKLPPRALGLVMEWASLHRDELKSEWEKARKLEPLDRIEPLE